MTSNELPWVREREFSAVTTADGDDLRVKLVGSADGASVEAMSQLFPKVHAEATSRGSKSVIVDLMELEFMNSSCIKVFVSWISTVEEMASPYRVVFQSNPKILWQRRSLHALSYFSASIISVETVGV